MKTLDYDLALDYSAKQTPDFFGYALEQYRKDGRFPFGLGLRTRCSLEPTVPLRPTATPVNKAFMSHTACLRAFEMCGYNVITVGPEMEKAFADTTLENVPLDHIRAPWKAFYVNLTGSEQMA